MISPLPASENLCMKITITLAKVIPLGPKSLQVSDVHLKGIKRTRVSVPIVQLCPLLP